MGLYTYDFFYPKQLTGVEQPVAEEEGGPRSANSPASGSRSPPSRRFSSASSLQSSLLKQAPTNASSSNRPPTGMFFIPGVGLIAGPKPIEFQNMWGGKIENGRYLAEPLAPMLHEQLPANHQVLRT